MFKKQMATNGFKAMPNSIDFYEEIFLHIIPVRIIVPWLIKNMNEILLWAHGFLPPPQSPLQKQQLAFAIHFFLSKNLVTSSEQRCWKLRADGCFWGQFFLKIFLNDCFSKTAGKLYSFWFTHILYFLPWRHVKEERIFMDFLSKSLDEKYKNTKN